MSSNESRVPAIRYWSYRISWVLIFCLVALPIIVGTILALSWFNGVDFYVWDPQPTNLSKLEPLVALFVAIATAVALSFLFVPLFFLQQMFNLWGKGEILTRAAAKCLKRTGQWVVIGTIIIGVVIPAIAIVFSAWFGVDIPMEISFELDGFLVGAIVYVVGMVLDEAARVAEDAELTI